MTRDERDFKERLAREKIPDGFSKNVAGSGSKPSGKRGLREDRFPAPPPFLNFTINLKHLYVIMNLTYICLLQ
jgi:hypothetical protein